MPIKLSTFVKLVPEAARPHLPASLRKFHVALMPWLSQVYYDDKLIHYELIKLMPRYGENRLEIGLHFESKNHDLNTQLLRGFERYIFEVREQLGDDWWAEQWDRGWTKLYTTMEFTALDEDYVEELGKRLAQAIIVLHPLYQMIRERL
ncbi:MAG: hypothetical protein KF726_16575 [Anaerolineae bacterium]|nr:hypothetical protein [Anaerolineae bacterium]